MNTVDWVTYTTEVHVCSCRIWEIQDQATGHFGFRCELSSQFAGCHLLAVSSHAWWGRNKLSDVSHSSYHGGPSLMTFSKPHYFPKAPSPRTGWSGLQDMNLGGVQPFTPSQWFIHVFIKLSMFSVMWSKVLCVYLMVQNLPGNNFNLEENSTCCSWTHWGLTWEKSWGLDEGIAFFWLTELCLLVLELHFPVCWDQILLLDAST